MSGPDGSRPPPPQQQKFLGFDAEELSVGYDLQYFISYEGLYPDPFPLDPRLMDPLPSDPSPPDFIIADEYTINNTNHAAGDKFIFNLAPFTGHVNTRPTQFFGQQQQPPYPPNPADAPLPHRQNNALDFDQPNDNVYDNPSSQMPRPHYAKTASTAPKTPKLSTATPEIPVK
jgi:hypothetical protein